MPDTKPTDTTEVKKESVVPTVEDTPNQPTAPARPIKPVAEGQKGKTAGSSVKKPIAEATAPKEEALPVTAVAPLMILKANPELFNSRIWHILVERQQALTAEMSRLDAERNEKGRELSVIERQMDYLLTPSPIFSQSGVPGSDFISESLGRSIEATRETRETVEGLIERFKALDDRLVVRVEKHTSDIVPPMEEVAPAEPVAEFTEDDFLADEETTAPVEEAPPVEEEVPDHEWFDVYQVGRGPSLDGLPLDLVGLSDVGEIATIVVGPNMSSNIANLSCEMARKDGADLVCIYVRFKKALSDDPNAGFQTSDWFRYSAFPAEMWAKLVGVVRDKMEGQPVSIGSFVKTHIKDAHERKMVMAQKLTREGPWVNVPTTAERRAQGGGQQRQAPATPRPAAPPQPPVRQSAPGAPVASIGEVLAAKGQPAPSTTPAPPKPATGPRPVPAAPRPAAPATPAEDVDIFG